MRLKPEVVDAYHPHGDTPVELCRLAGGSHAYVFPDGKIEYVKNGTDFRNEIDWRYGKKTTY